MVLSIVNLYLFFYSFYAFYITQLKLSLDSLLLSNQKNGVLGYSLFANVPYQVLY